MRITLEIGYRTIPKTLEPWNFLALEDFTPAGLTPINTELKTEGLEGETLSGPSTVSDRLFEFFPSYLEIRDDGVRVFKNSIYSGLYKFSYLARAVTAGTFWMRGSRIVSYVPILMLMHRSPAKRLKFWNPADKLRLISSEIG